MEEPDFVRRKIVDSIISNICINAGFNKTEIFALESLSEMFVAYVCQLLIQTKLFAELQNRTEPCLHDLASAFIELGIDLRSINKFIRSIDSHRIRRVAIPPVATIPKPAPILHAIKPKPHLNYINDHFPPFPDPHTYILTECSVKNEKDYQRTRELIAEQKLNMEKSLVKFRLKNNLLKFSVKQLSIFNEENTDTMFMLIKNETENTDAPTYLSGLLAN